MEWQYNSDDGSLTIDADGLRVPAVDLARRLGLCVTPTLEALGEGVSDREVLVHLTMALLNLELRREHAKGAAELGGDVK